MAAKLKKFVVYVSSFFGLLLIALIVLKINAIAGLMIGSILLIIPGLAIFKPMPALGLINRFFNFCIACFIGVVITAASLVNLNDEIKLKELREFNPQAYLSQIEDNRKIWLRELKELAPDRYEAEKARIEAAREMAEREAAHLKAERDAKERAEAERLAQERAAERVREKQEKVAAYIKKIEREIDGIQSFDPRQYTDSPTSLIIGLAVFSAWAKIYGEGKFLSLNAEQRDVRQKFKQEIIAQQRRSLPVFRDKYGPIMRKKLWEHDVSARTFGNRFTTVEFSGGIFAANRNIKTFQEGAYETLQLLRFKRVHYKWYKEAREYTYYDMQTLPDEAIVVWVENGRYRRID